MTSFKVFIAEVQDTRRAKQAALELQQRLIERGFTVELDADWHDRVVLYARFKSVTLRFRIYFDGGIVCTDSSQLAIHANSFGFDVSKLMSKLDGTLFVITGKR